MYNPSTFVENRIEVLHSFIRQHSFAFVLTNGVEVPQTSHVPTVFHPDEGPHGIIRFHLARANPHWKVLQSMPVLIVFSGVEHYITPSWYPSKRQHGKVVPTWNYTEVHARGTARLIEEHDALLRHLHSLTNQNEQAFEQPWSVNDAPRDYIEGMTKAIVGVEVAVESLEGKWKLNQNRIDADRFGVIEGLRTAGSSEGREMAQLMGDREEK
jgi:transcriptional regulator